MSELTTDVQELKQWRVLTVDPRLKDHDDQLKSHGKKLLAFERIEMQIVGAVKFVKIVSLVVGLIVGVLEIARFAFVVEHAAR